MRRDRTARLAALLLVLALALAGVLALAGGSARAATEGGPGAGVVPSPTPTPSATVRPPAPTGTPVPTAPATQPVPAPTPTDEPGPTSSPTAEPRPTSTPTPTPTTPADQDADGGVGQPRFSRPPAVTTSTTPWAELLLALAVVVAASVAVVAVGARRARTATGPDGAAGSDGSGTAATGAAAHAAEETAADTAELPAPAAPAEVLRLMVVAGEAMVDAGHTVSSVADTLDEIAAAHGATGAETVVLPTALLVSVPDGDGVATAAVTTGRRPLLLHQVDELTDVLDDASDTGADVPGLTARIALLRTGAPPFGLLARLGGYLLLSVGIGALLGGSWLDLLVAAGLGLAVGAVQLTAGRVPSGAEVLLTVATAFVVSAVVLLAARALPDLGVLPSLVAPLVLFLPGGLLTTGVIELATGQMLSGAGRLAAGTMQLVLLAGGIVAAAALVGVPAVDLASGGDPLGPLAPWAGVVAFGVGTVVYRCGRPRTIGWVVLVLAVAYGAQVLGGALLGGTLSAFVGALAMTPVALAVARFPSGPSPLVSFLPAFWMLVPGALGLVGVASLLDGEGTANGVSTLVTAGATMVAIALGVLVGLSASRGLPGRYRRWSLGGVPGMVPTGRPWTWPRRRRAEPPV